jgi:ABC-type Na+ transport system ATPase subunit NatA
MIAIEGLTKKYGTALAVDDVSFTAEAGRVTIAAAAGTRRGTCAAAP